jgi:murein DD-endopeptidase MepM/ murein hydrolase activator NlpD
VAEGRFGSQKRDKRHAFGRAMAPFLPDWQVFVRHPDGRARYFTFSRRRQAAVVAAFALVLGWAVGSTLILFHRPEAVLTRERALDAQTASFHTAEQRLTETRKMVIAMTHEVQAVHANLVVLAKSSGTLTKEHVLVPAKKPAAGPVAKAIDRMAERTRNQPGGPDVGAVREDLHRLQISLDRLERTYGEAVRNTAHIVDRHIAETEHPLNRLGINTERLVAKARPDGGEGGPFIPLSQMAKIRHKDVALTHLLSRMEHWYRLKGMIRTLPLGDPIHTAWRLDSPFGPRIDPINHEPAFHEGVDMGAPTGTKVFATGTGRVISTAPEEGYGNVVIVDNGDGFSTRYAHLSRVLVRPGQHVTGQTVLGMVGDTGRSTGPHLHYEVRMDNVPHNPLKFISVGRDASETR